MPTFILLTKLSPESLGRLKDRKQVWQPVAGGGENRLPRGQMDRPLHPAGLLLLHGHLRGSRPGGGRKVAMITME